MDLFGLRLFWHITESQWFLFKSSSRRVWVHAKSFVSNSGSTHTDLAHFRFQKQLFSLTGS